MRLIALTMRKGREGRSKELFEVRVTYSYEPGNEPDQGEVKRAILRFLEEALGVTEDGLLEKAGIQREDMREKRATMSFVEKFPES